MAKNIKKTSETRDLFNQPPENAVNNFSVPKNSVKDIMMNCWWLIVDVLWLNEIQSKNNLWDRFENIILWVMLDDQQYKEFFPMKKYISGYLQRKFPYAKSPLLVFEIIINNTQSEKKIPLCFDRYGKLDTDKTISTFSHSEIWNFLHNIKPEDINFQQYTIWMDVLKTSSTNNNHSWSNYEKTISSSSSKKQLQEQRRMLDDNFPVPEAIEWLPYIHIKDDILAIKYMIGLYTAVEIIDVCKKIDAQESPYNFLRLKTTLQSTLSSFHKCNYESLISLFSMDDEVVKTREWKWRLTMRLTNLMHERKIPDIKYYDGDIIYLPTWAKYQKELLFNVRPNEWKHELLCRIEEKKSGIIAVPKQKNSTHYSHGLKPNTDFYKGQDKNEEISWVLTHTNIIDAICKKHPEIFFWSDGKFDLARMKTENTFTTAMDTLEKILRKRYPYNNEYVETNKYLYATMDELLDTRKHKESLKKIVEGEQLLVSFFDDIVSSLSKNNADESLYSDEVDGVDFRLMATIWAMNFIWTEKQNISQSNRTIFSDRFDKYFVDDNFDDPRSIKQIIRDIIKDHDITLVELLKTVPDLNMLFRACMMKRNKERPALWLQRRTIRENLLAVTIPEHLKYYTSEKTPDNTSYFSMREFIRHLEQNDIQAAITIIQKYWSSNMIERATNMINFPDRENESMLILLFELAWLTETIWNIEKEKENIKKFFSSIISSLIQFWHGDIIDNEKMSDENWDNLHYLFDMIVSALQRDLNKGRNFEEHFTSRFIGEYGEGNPYKEVIWDIINLPICWLHEDKFSVFLVTIKHLVPMFASFLGNKNKDGILASFKRNALIEYFKKITPKQKIQNFRKKDPDTKNILYEKITKKNNFIRKSQQKEYAEILSAVIQNNHIQWVTVSVESLELRHPETRTKMNLPFIYGKGESELLYIVQEFLNNEVANAFLAQEYEDLPEVTQEIIDKIRKTLDEMDIHGIALLEDKQLLQYQDQTITLSEIAIDETYETNIRMWMSEFDGTMAALAEKIKEDHLRWLSCLQVNCNSEDNKKYDEKEEKHEPWNTTPDDEDNDLPF